jgi:hypothetical protein
MTAMHNIEDTHRALVALTMCRTNLRSAHVDAGKAGPRLTGQRAAKASELIDMITAAEAFAERLQVVVTGDLRADQT